MNHLPLNRRVLAGRTFDRSWSPGDSAMITRYSRPRANWWDVAGWVGAAVLVLLVLLVVYAPGWLNCFGQLAQL